MVLSKSNPQVIERFTAELTEEIDNILPILRDAFQDFKGGKVGRQLEDVTRRLFNEWLTSTLLPTVEEAAAFLEPLISLSSALQETGVDITRIQAKAKKGLDQLDGNVIPQLVADMIAAVRQGLTAEKAVYNDIWRAFDKPIQNFLVENAILIVGRLLMYFVGLDKNCWDALLLQHTLETPYLKHYWDLRERQSGLLPSLYHLNEFDWLYANHTLRQGLTSSELGILDLHESNLDKELFRLHRMIKSYEYSQVDLDVWEAVYQEFLSPEQISKLGFVTTPHEIVELILDLVEYTADKPGLCTKRILDPSCGSGTFLVEALTRLLRHLEKKMPCHAPDPRITDWEHQRKLLETTLTDIHGVDIHPFAVFLTTLNLTFQLIDKYSIVSRHYVNFGLDLDITTHDTLSKRPAIQAPAVPYTNARFQEMMERTRRFVQLLDSQFDYVVGNPPWGAVLKGVVGPLGNKARRLDYKERFESSHSPSGKYDIFVLFMERGIKWLKPRTGVLGMITQVNWVSQDFGEGIKKVMRSEGTPKIFVDLQKVGTIIFPKWTNYPAIIVIQRSELVDSVQVVEVSKS